MEIKKIKDIFQFIQSDSERTILLKIFNNGLSGLIQESIFSGMESASGVWKNTGETKSSAWAKKGIRILKSLKNAQPIPIKTVKVCMIGIIRNNKIKTTSNFAKPMEKPWSLKI